MKTKILAATLLACTFLSGPAWAADLPAASAGMPGAATSVTPDDIDMVAEAIEAMAARGMSREQIGNRLQSYGVTLSADTIDGVLSGMFGSNSRVGYDIMTALRYGGVKELRRQLVDAGYQAASDVVDDVAARVVTTITGSSCSSSAMSMALGAADTVMGMLGGGRATVLGQKIQLIEMIRANKCAAEQMDKLATSNQNEAKLLEYERKNIAAGTANNTAGINGMMGRTLPGLANGGFLGDEQAVQGQYGQVYPNAFPPLAPDDLIAANKAMEEHRRKAQLGSFSMQNRAVQEQGNSLLRARDHAAAGRAGQGLRSELQAMNAIGGEQILAINSLTAATVDNQRAEAEVHLQSESKKKAADAASDKYMATLSTCNNCQISKPFLE